jgi:hypothetical protein
MPRWVRCTEHPSGKRFYVNLSQVCFMRRHDDSGTGLYFENQKVHTLVVKETPDALLAKRPIEPDSESDRSGS